MTHGTEYTYIYGKCRCQVCRDGYSAHQKRRRDRKRARGQCCDCANPVEPGRRYCATHRAMRSFNELRRLHQMTLPARQCARCPEMIELDKYSAILCRACRTEAHRARQNDRQWERMHPDERPIIAETAAAIDAELARLDAISRSRRFRGTV